MDKMTGKSLDLVAENIKTLKTLFPEAVTEDKIDFEVLKALLGEEIESRQEHYKFTWNGKEQARAYARTPSMGTLRPCIEESSGRDGTPGTFDSDNLYIEGDNLEVLKLLQGAYHKKVKMIYIDPPYNTGKDFVYPDNFRDSIANYKSLTGQTDDEGKATRANPETSGRYHTDWLNMMFPRLILARNLLTDDGVIFISIGKEELHNLTLLMNDVFGEESFKNIITIRRGIKSVQEQFDTIDSLNRGHEYLLFYSKNSSQRFEKFYIQNLASNDDDDDDSEILGTWNNHWRGTDRPSMRYTLFGIKPDSGQWRWSEERSRLAINNYKKMISDLGEPLTQKEIDDWVKLEEESRGSKIDLLRLSSRGKPEHYIHPSDSKLASDLWIDIKPNGGSQLKRCMGKKYFDTPKSCNLMTRLIEFSCSSGDIVLDFFAGSSSMAEAVLQKNSSDLSNIHFIMIQLPEPTFIIENGEKIAKKENKMAFNDGFLTIAENGKERIRCALKRIREELQRKIIGYTDDRAQLQAKLATMHTGMLPGMSSESASIKADIQKLDEQIADAEKAYAGDMGFRVFKLDTSNYIPWNPEPGNIELLLRNAVDNILTDRTRQDLLYEILLKNNLPLTLPIEERKIGENTVFTVGGGISHLPGPSHSAISRRRHRPAA